MRLSSLNSCLLADKKDKDKGQPGSLQAGSHSGSSPRHSPSSPSPRRQPASSISGGGGSSPSGSSSAFGASGPQSPSHSSSRGSQHRAARHQQHHQHQEPFGSPQRHGGGCQQMTSPAADQAGCVPDCADGGQTGSGWRHSTTEDGAAVGGSQTKRNRPAGVATSGDNSS